MDSWHARARSLQSLGPLCAPLCSLERSREEPAEPRDPSRVGVRSGGPRGGPPQPPPGPRRACHCGPDGPVGGRMTSAAGWIIKAQAEPRLERTRRRRAALGPATASQPGQTAPRSPAGRPAGPKHRRCRPSAPRAPGHHAPLPAAGLRPAALAPLAPALRSQARGAAKGGYCREDVGTCEGQWEGWGV